MDRNDDQPTKLNPFALPLETDVLFMLMIVAGLVLVLGLSVAIAAPYLFITSTILEDYADSVVYALEGNQAAGQITDIVQNFQQAYERNFPIFAIAAVGPMGLPILFFGVTSLVYYRYSARLIKRKNLSRLKRSTDPKLYDLVNHLSAEVGLEIPPMAHINNETMSANSQVWADNKRYHISFGMGSRTLLRKKTSYLKAIILHELAHITNKDVAYTYFTQSLWWVIGWVTGAMLLIALCVYFSYVMYPQQIGAFLPGSPTSSQSELIFEYLQGVGLPWLKYAAVVAAIILSVIPTFSLSIVIILIRALLLRLRELYADCRAASWGAAHEFKVLFARQPAQENSFLQKLLSLHPPVEMRQAYLEDPSRFFRLSYMTSITTGLLIGFILFTAIITLFVYHEATLALGDVVHALDLLKNSSNLALGSFLDGKGIFPFIYAICSFLMLLLPILFLLFIAFLITEVGGIAVQRVLVVNEITGRTSWQTSRDLGMYAGSFGVGACVAIILLSLPLSLLMGWSFKVLLGILSIVFLMTTGLTWIVLEYIYRFSRLSFRRYQGYVSPQRIGKRIRTSAILLVLTMLVGTVGPPLATIVKGAIHMIVSISSSPYRDVILDFVGSAQRTLLEEPTMSISELPNSLPPDVINSFLEFFPTWEELILLTVFCFVTVTILFFVLTRKMLKPSIRFVMQCPQCQTKLTDSSWLEQTCPHCGLRSGWWTVPEDIAERKHLLGLEYLERAYDLNGRNRNKQALSVAQQAMKYVRHKSEVFNLMGIIYQKLQRQEEAKHAFSQAVALSAGYETARQNMANLTGVLPLESKRSPLGNLWNVLTTRTKKSTNTPTVKPTNTPINIRTDTPTPKTRQNKMTQTEIIVLAIIGYLFNLIFPNLYEAISSLFLGIGFIGIVYLAVSGLLASRLSDYARPGLIVISLLVVQLSRLLLSFWIDGSIIPLLDLFLVLISISVILWLILLPGISAYLASIVTTIALFLYQMASLVILLSLLPAFSFSWILDLGLTVAIVYFSWVGYKGYDIKVANRQQLELPST